MFNADNWENREEWRHKKVMARVYYDADRGHWVYEYHASGCVNIGKAATKEVAMQRIDDHLNAGIAITKRKIRQ